MQTSSLTCGTCGGDVHQEGAFMRCQNFECRAQTPIDVQAAVNAANLVKYENLNEAGDVNA